MPTKIASSPGCDLMHTTNNDGEKKMVLIETNSCPSGLKSTPLFDEMDEFGGYRVLLERTFLPRVKVAESLNLVPNGRLCVLFDKNPMEASGYAAVLADLTQEIVHLVPCFDKDDLKRVRFTNQNGHLEVLVDEPLTRDTRSPSVSSDNSFSSPGRGASSAATATSPQISPIVPPPDDVDDENVE